MFARAVYNRRRLGSHAMLVVALLVGPIVLGCTATTPRSQKETMTMPESTMPEAAAAPESRTFVLEVPTQLGDRMRLRFQGVRHSRRSFEVRIFLNQPEADASTPVLNEPTYAGSFHMYGHGLPGEDRTGRDAIIDDGERVGGQRLEAFETLVDVSRARLALDGQRRVQVTLVVVSTGRTPLPHETFQFDTVHLES